MNSDRMLEKPPFWAVAGALCLVSLLLAGPAGARGSLAAWKDGEAQRSIVAFVEAVTQVGGPDFVPLEKRIAVFADAGTLWVERSVPPGTVYAEAAASAEGEAPDPDAWLKDAEHPGYKRPYTRLVYRPMTVLMQYLRANGFKIVVLSRNDVALSRAMLRHSLRKWEPNVVAHPGAGEIETRAGEAPILAFGSAVQDLPILERVAAREGRTLSMLVIHDDGEREYVYDDGPKPPPGVGTISIRKDWKNLFPAT
jgi:hypothetical protein